MTDRFIIYLILIHAWTWDRTCSWEQVEFWSIFPAVKCKEKDICEKSLEMNILNLTGNAEY